MNEGTIAGKKKKLNSKTIKKAYSDGISFAGQLNTTPSPFLR